MIWFINAWLVVDWDSAKSMSRSTKKVRSLSLLYARFPRCDFKGKCSKNHAQPIYCRCLPPVIVHCVPATFVIKNQGAILGFSWWVMAGWSGIRLFHRQIHPTLRLGIPGVVLAPITCSCENSPGGYLKDLTAVNRLLSMIHIDPPHLTKCVGKKQLVSIP